MRRWIGFAIALVVVSVVAFNLAFAEEKQVESEVKGSVILRNDWIRSGAEETNNTQAVLAYLHWKNLGMGCDFDLNAKTDFFQFKPYLTFNHGSWYGLIGYSSNNNDQDFVQTGIWYIRAIGKFNVVVDLRNYWSTGKQSDFLDAFSRITYAATDDLFFGADLIYDRFWQDRADWFLAGPLLGYRLAPKVGLLIRLSREWDCQAEKTSKADRIRVELKFSF